jgi:hypothetical protein
MGLQRLFGMTARMNGVAGRGVGMVRGGFVLPGLVAPGGFHMVPGCMGQVFRSSLVCSAAFFDMSFLHG